MIRAHYDHLGPGRPDVRKEHKGKMHPGADDNASGVAALLELARFFGSRPKPDRTLVFAAFTGEEAGKPGSKKCVSDYAYHPAKNSIGTINLDDDAEFLIDDQARRIHVRPASRIGRSDLGADRKRVERIRTPWHQVNRRTAREDK